MSVRIVMTLILLAAAWEVSFGSQEGAVPQIRVDSKELGYPPVDVIPADESEVRALAVSPDGRIFGATSGRRSHLFVLDPALGTIEPLGFIPQTTMVHRALVVDAIGDVYVGTSPGVDNGAAGYERYEGGHLFRYSPAADSRRQGIRIDKPCRMEDRGVIVKGEGVYSLAIDRERRTIFGLTYPGGYLFIHDIASGSSTTVGRVAEALIPGERFESERNIGRALAVAANGDVYTSGEGGYLYRLERGKGKLTRTRVRLPGVPGREAYNRVDAWAQEADGLLYGATSDGYLFVLDPGRESVANLGKPLNQYRIRGLVRSHHGLLYGVGGDRDELARMFSYDPKTGIYHILGFVDVDRRPFYAWRAFLFDSMAVGNDGTVYLGQAERSSRLFIYHPP